jgi:hypothetical protein
MGDMMMMEKAEKRVGKVCAKTMRVSGIRQTGSAEQGTIPDLPTPIAILVRKAPR